jgi:hypothetical protein
MHLGGVLKPDVNLFLYLYVVYNWLSKLKNIIPLAQHTIPII